MYKITSRFHQQESFRNSPHNGIDFAMQTGTELKAIQCGTIRVIDYGDKLSGKTVLIDTSNNKTLVYGHLSDFTVKSGDTVQVGDLIGHAGSTGNSTGSHLHFSLKQNGTFVDPSSFINDIQNMNTPNHFAQQTTEVKLSFFDFFQQHMDSLTNLKLNLINLPYDVLFIQIGKQFLQFISTHSSFLDFIIGHII